jgi:hypothetical protein
LTSRRNVRSLFLSQERTEGDGQLHALGLLEELREECIWVTSSEFYFRIDELLRELANPNLHDIPARLPFRVELWDRHAQHIRWVIAFTLRNGILVIREHVPKLKA